MGRESRMLTMPSPKREWCTRYIIAITLLVTSAFGSAYTITRAIESYKLAAAGHTVKAPFEVSSCDSAWGRITPVRESTRRLRSNPPGMVWIAGGKFLMGTDDPQAHPAEKPAHWVKVSGFWIDQTEVTNADFRRFVEATQYITTARAPR